MQFLQEFTSENRVHESPFKIKTEKVDFRGNKYDMDENGVLYDRASKVAIGVWESYCRNFSQRPEDIQFYYEHSRYSPQDRHSDTGLIEVSDEADVMTDTVATQDEVSENEIADDHTFHSPIEWNQMVHHSNPADIPDHTLYNQYQNSIQNNEPASQAMQSIHPHWKLLHWASSVHDKLIEQSRQRVIRGNDDKEQDADVIAGLPAAVHFYDTEIEKMERELQILKNRKAQLFSMDQTKLDNLIFRIKVENLHNSDIRKFFDEISF